MLQRIRNVLIQELRDSENPKREGMQRKHFCLEGKIELLFDDFRELRGYGNQGPKSGGVRVVKENFCQVKLEPKNPYPWSKN